MTNKRKKIIIIGGGAAGIGMGITLKELGIDDFLILEKKQIGQSFLSWPKETRFITPSFTSNGFGMPDLNAIAVDTAPSYTLGKERLSGADYAHYLQLAAKAYDLPVLTETQVIQINKNKQGYCLTTTRGQIEAMILIFAVGEFSFPNKSKIKGGEKWGIHYGEISTWQEITGEKQVIIGGNESALDAAIVLAKSGKDVTIFTSESGLDKQEADPSKRLSPYTRQKFFAACQNETIRKKIHFHPDITITEINKKEQMYHLNDNKGIVTISENPPILCTGFKNGAAAIAHWLFSYQENGEAILTDFDESTIHENVFLIGPHVHKENTVFCYIYKFRQRFAVIANQLAKKNQWPIKQEALAYFKAQSFYLEDCTCDITCRC